MLGEGWQIITEAYDRYSADGIMQVLVIASVVILLINEKKPYVKHMVYYTIALVILICIPPIAYVLNKYFIQDVYFRVFWLVPGTLLTVYAVVKAYEHANRRRGNAILVTFAAILMLGGKFVYTNENFVKAENRYKIPNEAIEICEIVTTEGEDVKIVVPEDIVSYIRQYNPKIEMLYGRSLGKDTQRGKKYKLLLQINEELTEPRWVGKYLKNREIDFLIMNKELPNNESLKALNDYGYNIYSETDSYIVLKWN